MSHHFDTDQAKSDPRLNICDLYVFKGAGARTVLAMTCCADAGISSPDAFHSEGTYAFRIDLNGDNREDLAFKCRFGEPQHVLGDEHRHEQSFSVWRATDDEIPKAGGTLIAEGFTGNVVEIGEVQAFAGIVPELWAADAFTVADGVSPASNRVTPEFPYYGAHFSPSEQTGLAPIQGNIGYGTA